MAVIAALAMEPMFWGAAGSFIYAAPRLSVCLFAAQQTEGHWVQCGFEFAVSMVIGAIAAGILGPWIGVSVLKSADPAQARVIAATIGLLANPIAPRVIDVLSGRVLQMLKGSDSK